MSISTSSIVRPPIQWHYLSKLQYNSYDATSLKITKTLALVFLGVFAALADLVNHGYLTLKPKKVEITPEIQPLDKTTIKFFNRATFLDALAASIVHGYFVEYNSAPFTTSLNIQTMRFKAVTGLIALYFDYRIFKHSLGMLNAILKPSKSRFTANLIPAVSLSLANVFTVELIKNIALYSLFGEKPSLASLNFLKQLPTAAIILPCGTLIKAAALKGMLKIYYSTKSIIFG